MEVASRRLADVVVVAPVGRLDHGSADELERVLRPLVEPSGDAPAGLVLDFGRVDYVSSVGLRVLMIAAKEMRRRGARIAVVGLQPVVAEIFAISRFHSVLDVFDALPTALKAISAAAAAAYGSPAVSPST
ncbi:MAG: STAS domain-containing protein [Betaproteobacteria bacterium]|nr:STAS domain-containing protein [Betaproteobacteria bacterium]